MEYKPTTTDEEKPVTLEDRDYMFYQLLTQILNQLKKLNRHK